MKTKNKYILGAIILFMTCAVVSQLLSRRNGREEFKIFNEANISGHIQEKVDGSVSGTRIKVNGQVYYFLPTTGKENDNGIFSYTAEVGDSLFKQSFSDTLLLFKKGKLLKYTFIHIK